MLENLSKYRIVLASNSPRRKELLSGLGIEYKVMTLKDIDESYPSSLKGEEIPIYISSQKAKAYDTILEDDMLIITADTIVYQDNEVLGKPKDEKEACCMLKKLSGRTHEVITGVTLKTKSFCSSFAVTSLVTFDLLNEDEIDFYVKNYRPMDKAGAYGIQEWIGFIGVKSLNGSYFNVMGLPVQRLYQELKKL